MIIRKDTKLGFTLAEVLITLVIIGVIAAMTVPTLMKNTQNQELVTGLKKAHSTLHQALVNIAKNNDASPGDYSFLNNVVFVDEFAKVANVIKKCNNTADCFSSALRGSTTEYKLLNGTEVSFTEGKSFITADGQIFSYIPITSSTNTWGISQEDKENAIMRIIVDVNGHKKPNVSGRDLFYFYIINGKGLIPAGSHSVNDCTKNGAGYTCTSKVIKENAIKY